MAYFLGIDLGGTNIKAGIVTSSGQIFHKASMKTNLSSDVQICNDMAELSLMLLSEAGLSVSDIMAVGVGSPGTPDNQNGFLLYANNLPFSDTPMRSLIQKKLPVPLYIGNDANCAALAEAQLGAAKGTDISVTITLGTGLGSGVVIHDRIYSGFNGAGCEFGHIVIIKDGQSCTCGRRGCFEAYASGTALVRMTKETAEKFPDSYLAKLVQDSQKGSARHAFEAMRQGDEKAKELVEFYLDCLSEGIADIINALMPEVIVIGGGISNEGEFLLEAVRERVWEKAYLASSIKKPEIRLAKMKNDAGILGAALMGKGYFDDGIAG